MVAQKGELGEREATEGRELFLLVESGRIQGGGKYRKSTPLKAAGERRKGTQRTEQQKGERKGFKFHQDSINRGAQSLKLHSSIPGVAVVGG